MLLSPSRADCIVFSVDGVLVDGAGVSAALSRTLSLSWSELLKREASEAVDAAPYLQAARRHNIFGSRGDIAWALLSLAMKSERQHLAEALPAPEKWEARLIAAEDGRGMDDFTSMISAADCRTIVALYNDIYFGPTDGKAPLLEDLPEGACVLERPLFSPRWDKLPLPAGICTSRDRDELDCALRTLGWQDLPKERCITSEIARKPDAAGLENFCRSLGCRWPLYLGSLPADLELMENFGRGDFISVGTQINHNVVKFPSAADALRAILGVV